MNPAGQAGVHATAVAVGEAGVLVRGPSGGGKSALALALLFADPAGTRLVADDRVRLTATAGRLVAEPPAELAGLLEVRGQGILRFAHQAPAPIGLVVDLRPPAECPRLPERADATVAIEGIVLPRLVLPIGAADGAMRVHLALARLRLACVQCMPSLLQCGIDL